MRKRLCKSVPLLCLPSNVLIYLSLTKRCFENGVIKLWKWSASHWFPSTHFSSGSPVTRIYTAILYTQTTLTQELTPGCSLMKPWTPSYLSFIKFSITFREEVRQWWKHQSEVPLSCTQLLTLLTFSFKVNISGGTEIWWVCNFLLLMQFQTTF